MAKSYGTVSDLNVVGALFEDNHNANQAAQELIEEGFSNYDITVDVKLTDKEQKKAFKASLKAKGFEDPDQLYFEKAVEEGKTLVSVTNVPKSKVAAVIEVLNKNGAHYNPDGSRNVRDDVVGMTTGAVVGAAIGAVIGGPVGAAAGFAVGAGAGGAVGKKLEHSE